MAGREETDIQSSITKEWIESIMNCRGADESQAEKPPRINRVHRCCEKPKNLGNTMNPSTSIVVREAFGEDQGSEGALDENLISKFDDEKLARMMLLDGSFVLYYIHCVVTKNIYDLEVKSHIIDIVQQDLFLLENQLPFLVLRELMINSTKLTENEWVRVNNINEFIRKNIMDPSFLYGRELNGLHNERGLRTAHLLELLHQRMYYFSPFPDFPFQPVLQFTITSLKELKELRIKLERTDNDALIEICDHKPTCTTLKIPSIVVDESTRCKLLNLIAYEMCPNTPKELVITTYVFLMNLFIRDPDDVKELRSANILQNFLHNDGEVAQLFNEIGDNLGSIFLNQTYRNVLEKILQGYVQMKTSVEEKKKMRKYMEDLMTDYFKNPWTIVALFGAVLGLFFTAIQAYFQVWSRPSSCESLPAY
ncbi:hypothetical protein F0562_017243 [Nyssa sinensis]|uniref:Uncharacterized protein n=1 Tax=Nyssa sinensis TaxID=561372 RepID=A0A5J4ZG06_9ASTE|nr:hypothetical protein F0562_017243 [Nyssa sinensis]